MEIQYPYLKYLLRIIFVERKGRIGFIKRSTLNLKIDPWIYQFP